MLAFWSFGSELSTAPLIERLHGSGTRSALPRIVDGELEAADYRPGDPVTETSFGAFEPVGGRCDRSGRDRRGRGPGGGVRS